MLFQIYGDMAGWQLLGWVMVFVGLVVMNDKILEIERLAELRRLADGGVDHGGALCVGVLLRDDLPRDRPHHLLKHFPPLLS